MRFWVAGGLVPAEQAHIGVLDHGFTVGDGVFETLKTVMDPDVGVVPFAMDRHIARLARSAEGMGITAPEPDEVRDALLAVCAANAELAAGGRLRVTLTSGAGPLGSDRMQGAPTLAVAASPAVPWPATATVARSPWPRNERSPLAGLKSTSYAENVLALAHARRIGAGEALMANLSEDLCEGTGSNVFVVLEGKVVTPTLSSGCLAGITRGLVLEWCSDAGLDVVERAIAMAELARAEEIFLTSSTRDVHPVAEMLDQTGASSWSAQVGPVSQQVADVFRARSAADWNP